MGRQHQGIDRPGVRQVPEGSVEQGKFEKTGCKIICGAPTTLAVKGLMLLMLPFECMGICVLSPAHKSKMRGYLVYVLIVKYLSHRFCLNSATVY